MTKADDRPVVDLLDVLKGRVEVCEPIFITGKTGEPVTYNYDDLRQRLAAETSKLVRTIEIVYRKQNCSSN